MHGRRADLVGQGLDDIRMTPGKQRERDGALGADSNFAELPADDAVAAQGERGREQAAHERFPVADADAVVAQDGQPVLNKSDVGGRAAHVHDDRLAGADERAAAQGRGCRAGQQRLDCVVHGKGAAHQAAVRPHDHDLGLDAARAEGVAGRVQEIAGDRDEAGI